MATTANNICRNDIIINVPYSKLVTYDHLLTQANKHTHTSIRREEEKIGKMSRKKNKLNVNGKTLDKRKIR